MVVSLYFGMKQDKYINAFNKVSDKKPFGKSKLFIEADENNPIFNKIPVKKVVKKLVIRK
jgi:hypothetical protein